MKLYEDTEFGKAVKELFSRLNKIIGADNQHYEDGTFRAYVFGGAAVHIYTNNRSSKDVDVEFSTQIPAFDDEDVVVTFLDDAARRKPLTFDGTFTPTLGLLHDDYIENAEPFMNNKGDALWVYLVSPLDLAISKLGRFAGHDLDDILALAKQGLIEAEALKKAAEFALVSYVGNTTTVQMNIDAAVKAIKEINR